MCVLFLSCSDWFSWFPYVFEALIWLMLYLWRLDWYLAWGRLLCLILWYSFAWMMWFDLCSISDAVLFCVILVGWCDPFLDASCDFVVILRVDVGSRYFWRYVSISISSHDCDMLVLLSVFLGYLMQMLVWLSNLKIVHCICPSFINCYLSSYKFALIINLFWLLWSECILNRFIYLCCVGGWLCVGCCVCVCLSVIRL